jgi:hypothetical protein
MGFAVRLAVAFAVLCLDAAVAQEGYFGHGHEKWHHGFYQTLERPDTKSPCCICPDAPTRPHQPVEFMVSPVGVEEMNAREVFPEMDAILSIDTTKERAIASSTTEDLQSRRP